MFSSIFTKLYCRSVKPLLDDAEFQNTKKIVQEFVKNGGIGEKLTHKLQEKYEKTENWVIN